jgi:hypothetical protein
MLECYIFLQFCLQLLPKVGDPTPYCFDFSAERDNYGSKVRLILFKRVQENLTLLFYRLFRMIVPVLILAHSL